MTTNQQRNEVIDELINDAAWSRGFSDSDILRHHRMDLKKWLESRKRPTVRGGEVWLAKTKNTSPCYWFIHTDPERDGLVATSVRGQRIAAGSPDLTLLRKAEVANHEEDSHGTE